MELPFDNTRRRRIHLMRHADAAYWLPGGGRVSDPRIVPLTEKGEAEAEAMGAFLSHLTFDRAMCTDLPRTQMTAKRVLRDRPLSLEIVPGLQEINSGPKETRAATPPFDYAYGFFRAHEPGRRYLEGEKFSDFRDRVLGAFETVLRDPDWTNLLLVAHGGVNRVILGWVMGTGLEAFASVEQDSCCLNIIDIDCDRDTGAIVRRVVRAVNLTAYDPAKDTLRFLTMEQSARRTAGLTGK